MTAQQPPAPNPAPQPGAPSRGGIAQPPKKGSNVLLFILLGCGGIVLLGVLVMAAVGYFVYSKAKDAGIDPGLMKRNPPLAAAKIAVMNNPDVELVGIDENKSTITYKDKKTGKTVTVNASEIQNGKWSVHSVDADGKTENVETNVKPEGENGQVTVKSDKGTVTYGGGKVDAPAWIPAYPGGTAKSIMSTKTDESNAGMFSVQTDDAPQKVAAFYKSALEKSGFKVTESTFSADKTTQITLGTEKSEDGRNLLVVIVQEEGKPVTVSLSYEEKKK
ncbi:MAG: hypothetical protein HY291_15470 [Planctomycetes bacterium]|nr:hypothetical protein [Planctomycetota bacterium]